MRHLAEHLSAVESADVAPQRPDMEFLARMLGVGTLEPPTGLGHVRRLTLADCAPKSDAQLAADIESHLADPIAVARAYRRVGELLEQCAAAHTRASVSIQSLN